MKFLTTLLSGISDLHYGVSKYESLERVPWNLGFNRDWRKKLDPALYSRQLNTIYRGKCHFENFRYPIFHLYGKFLENLVIGDAFSICLRNFTYTAFTELISRTRSELIVEDTINSSKLPFLSSLIQVNTSLAYPDLIVPQQLEKVS